VAVRTGRQSVGEASHIPSADYRRSRSTFDLLDLIIHHTSSFTSTFCNNVSFNLHFAFAFSEFIY